MGSQELLKTLQEATPFGDALGLSIAALVLTATTRYDGFEMGSEKQIRSRHTWICRLSLAGSGVLLAFSSSKLYEQYPGIYLGLITVNSGLLGMFGVEYMRKLSTSHQNLEKLYIWALVYMVLLVIVGFILCFIYAVISISAAFIRTDLMILVAWIICTASSVRPLRFKVIQFFKTQGLFTYGTGVRARPDSSTALLQQRGNNSDIEKCYQGVESRRIPRTPAVDIQTPKCAALWKELFPGEELQLAKPKGGKRVTREPRMRNRNPKPTVSIPLELDVANALLERDIEKRTRVHSQQPAGFLKVESKEKPLEDAELSGKYVNRVVGGRSNAALVEMGNDEEEEREEDNMLLLWKQAKADRKILKQNLIRVPNPTFCANRGQLGCSLGIA